MSKHFPSLPSSFRIHPLAAALTVISAFSSHISAKEIVEETVVYGTFSDGLSRSLDLKQDADTIVDAIVASDIGKLPALNLAEALQRVPGVTITREAGEGQFVTVRGLGPNFQAVNFNGLPIAYNENIRDSGQSGRQFRFRTLPADLVEGVVVQKSATADTIDGGIGSTIDVLTTNPLDREAFIATRLYGSYEENSSEFNPNGSVSSSWRNDAESFGVFGGLSFLDREAQFDRFQSFGYDERTVAGVEGVQVSRNYSTTLEQEKRSRVSFLGGAQWRPSAVFELDLDVLYTEFNNDIAENRVRYEFGSRVEDELAPNSARIENGVLTAATINGGRVERNAEFSEQSHENTAINLKATFTAGDWTMSPKLSYSNAESGLDTPLQRIDARTTDSAGLEYSFDLGSNAVGDQEITRLSTNLDLTNAAAIPFRRYRIRPINSEDEDVSFAWDAEYSFTDVSFGGIELTAFKTGFIFSDRFRDYNRRDRSLVARDGITVDASFFDGPIPTDAFGETISNRSPWVGPNFGDFAAAFVVEGEFAGVRPQAGDLEPTPSDLRQSYRVDEEISALYARFDFASSFDDVPVTGNIGLRWVDTTTSVEGALVEAGADGLVSTARTTDGDYTELLPSININFAFTDNVKLRLASSRTLTRPSLADLRDATIPNSDVLSAAFENGTAGLNDPALDFSGSGGNPNLAPYLALSFDASLEWYFSEFGALTVSAFHKDISDYISTDDRVETISLATNSGSSVPVDFAISRPQNIGDVNISGMELGFTNKLDNGLGLAMALTLVTSDIELNASTGNQAADVQGVSDINYSLTPFFEADRFEAHLSWNFRSDYVSNFAGGVQATPATGTVAITDDFGSLDFGLSYNVTDNIDLFAEGVNLLEEKQVTYFGDRRLVAQINHYGRTLNVGVRAQF